MTPQELKAAILQLAIQGRLVEQRPEEGTGAELLREILAAKNAKGAKDAEKKLTRSRGERGGEAATTLGKISAHSAPPREEILDAPFDIPESWVWVRLKDLMLDVSTGPFGSMLHKADYCDGGIPLVNPMNIQNGRIVPSDKMRVSTKTAERLSSYRLSEGMVVVARRGELGRCASVEKGQEGWLCGTGSFFLNPSTKLFVPYITLIISSPYARQLFSDKAVGTTMANLNHNLLKALLIPLPPLAEQKRIVAKIEELLPLIDRYEKAWGRLEDFNRRFPVDMQKSLLQMAIQGKLVEQRAEEGTGAELLEKIFAAKNAKDAGKSLTRRRGERGGSAAPNLEKNSAHSAPPREEILDAPFDIPESWVWVRIGNLFDISRGGSPRPIKAFLTTEENGLNWIKIGDTEKNSKYINSSHEKIIPAGLSKTRRVYKGDLLLTNSMSFGRPYILNIDGCIHDGWLVLHPLDAELFKDFFFYLLSSPVVFHQFQVSAAGAVVQNLNSDKVAQTVIPLPPLAEQKRIVAKLEELLPLCEKLK